MALGQGQLNFSIGLQPDMLVCRSNNKLEQDIKSKIASFCDVELDAVTGPDDGERPGIADLAIPEPSP